jgi:hypothetical protein
MPADFLTASGQAYASGFPENVAYKSAAIKPCFRIGAAESVGCTNQTQRIKGYFLIKFRWRDFPRVNESAERKSQGQQKKLFHTQSVMVVTGNLCVAYIEYMEMATAFSPFYL